MLDKLAGNLVCGRTGLTGHRRFDLMTSFFVLNGRERWGDFGAGNFFLVTFFMKHLSIIL